jgi:hypothetical protein
MGAQTGGKGQQPPNMQGMASPYAPQGGQQAQPRGGQYPQAMNMAQGWGGGWSQQPPQGGYQGGSPMQFGGGWWGPQQNVPQMQPWGAQAGSPGAGNNVMQTFDQLYKEDPRLAYHFMQRGGPQNWNANKEAIQQQYFGGDLQRYNQFVNDSDYGNLSDQERWRLNDLAGLPSPDRPGGVAPAAPGAVNTAPVGGVSLQTPASASPPPMLQGPLPWQKASQPPPPRMKDARWRGLMPGGSPAWRDMAITN